MSETNVMRCVLQDARESEQVLRRVIRGEPIDVGMLRASGGQPFEPGQIAHIYLPPPVHDSKGNHQKEPYALVGSVILENSILKVKVTDGTPRSYFSSMLARVQSLPHSS